MAGSSVCLSAVGNADDQNGQNVIAQRVGHPLVSRAKPVAGLALQGFDVSGGAGIGGEARQ